MNSTYKSPLERCRDVLAELETIRLERLFAHGLHAEAASVSIARVKLDLALKECTETNVLHWREQCGKLDARPRILKSGIKEHPCVHEWYQGICVHCEITVKEFRAARVRSGGENSEEKGVA